MTDGKPLAMFFNGSPRKNWNTAKMLDAARDGAAEAGAATESVNLYEIDFKGCMSCFACKLKDAATAGVCAVRDPLRPVLERARRADVIVLGSPIYYSFPTGVLRAFMERLLFPLGTYLYDENGRHVVLRDHVVETAMIYTMNCPREYLDKVGYPPILEANAKNLTDIFGACETLCAYNTYQFADYSRYAMNLFKEEDKRAYRDAHFPADLAAARALGRRLVERAAAR